jgi:serpin B
MHTQLPNRRRFLSLAGIAAGGLLAKYSAVGRASFNLTEPFENAKDLANAINTFAADLYTRLAKNTKGTLFFSPFSISTALAMTSAGAKGKTLEEMEKVLHLHTNSDRVYRNLLMQLNSAGLDKKRGYELTTANALWAMKGYPWRQEFLNHSRKNFEAGIEETDFSLPEAARHQINSWVEKATREKIKNLIPEGGIDTNTRMVLTNAIYFKGDWASKFDEKLTRNAPFLCIDGTKAVVPLMTQTGEFEYGELPSYIDRKPCRVQVLQMPYIDNKLSMRIYLPADPGAIDRLPQWLAKGDRSQDAIKMQTVQVSLPSFKAESKFSLRSTLMELGIIEAFGNADFSGMHDGPDRLAISEVLHRALVDVNEKGTEAAAATGVVIKRLSVPSVEVFRADHPFLFTIRDNKTGTILFMGRYNGPS